MNIDGYKPSDNLGVAIVGCGYWGINYARLLCDLPNVNVVAICEQRPERLQEIRRRFPAVQATPDLETTLALDGIDAVVVCTNATAHFDVTRQCLMAGKHVLVEKPMATSTDCAQQLVDLAQSQYKVLMVGHIFLYNAGIRKVKSYIEEHQVGEVYYLYARRTNLGPVRCDVNALWDLAPHDISIMNYLLEQRPEWVSAVGMPVLHNCREDVGFIVLGYPHGVLGHVHVSWAEPNKVREVVVVGSEKRIVFNDLDPLERVRIFEKGIAPAEDGDEPASYGEHLFSIRDGDIISPRIDVSEPLKAQCNHFVDCVLHGKQPLSDGINGLEVVRIMEAANQSIAGKGRPVELEWTADVGSEQKMEQPHDYRSTITGTVR